MERKSITKILFAFVGILFIGTGVAWNASAMLGNDPVGIIYDGVRSFANLTTDQLGMVSNYVNYGLILLLLFVGRKYLNIGTLIYILPYGLFVTFGTWLYQITFPMQELWSRILAATFGCLILYVGVGIFIAMNIGLDPFTGIVMVLADKLGWNYRKTKILFDICLVIVGTLLGGTLGIITLITAMTAGPVIQAVAEWIKKRIREEGK